MKKKYLIAILVVIAVFIAGSFYWRSQQSHPSKPSAKKAIRAGAILPLTGSVSVYGEYERNGLELALQDLSHDGNPLTLIIEDSQGLPKVGVAAAQKLINVDRCDVLISSLTGVSLAIKPIVRDKNIPVFALTMSSSFADAASKAFRFYPGIEEEGTTLAEFLPANAGKPCRVATLTLDQEAINEETEKVLHPSITRAGCSLVASERFSSMQESNLRGIVQKVISSKPNLLFVNAYNSQLPLVFKLLREGKPSRELQIFSGLNLAVAVEKGEINPDLVEGVGVAVPQYFLDTSPAAKRFESRFMGKYNKKPDFDAAYAYDLLKFIASEETLKNLPIARYEGVVGIISFDENGRSRTPWARARYRNGILSPL